MELTNTDTRLQQEESQILLNRSKLEVGKKYTYKKITEVLNIKYYSGGNGRPQQIKRIGKYIEWSKETGNIVLDNNIPVSTLDTVATKGTNSIYFKDFSHVMLYKLAEYLIKHPNAKYVRLSRNYAIRFSELVSYNFIYASDEDKKLFVSSALNIGREETNNYLNNIRNNALNIFTRSCKQLEKKGVIKLNSNILIQRYDYNTYKKETDDCDYNTYLKERLEIADPDFVSDILTMESKVLKEMGLNSKYHADVAGRWGEFKSKVCSRLGIENYWDNYDISLNRDDKKGVLAEFESTFKISKDELKSLFADNIKASKNKKLKNLNSNERDRLNNIFIFGTDTTFIPSLEKAIDVNNKCIQGIKEMTS